MDLRQLRYFVDITEAKSFTGAASRLHVAQPALSRHIRNLEQELGVKLFRRHARGAEPTAAGRVLYERATRILHEVSDARLEVIRFVTEPQGVVNFAFPPSISKIIANPLLEDCQKILPGISLQMVEGWTGHILEWLLADRCDLGILYASQAHDQLGLKPFITQDLFIITSSQNGELDRDCFTLSEVFELPLIVPTYPHGLRLVIEQWFAAHERKPNIVFEAEVWSVIKEIVQAGQAFTLLPPCEVHSEIEGGQLAAVPIEAPGIQRTLCVAQYKDKELLPEVEKVAELIHLEAPGYFI
jgi:LysR family nitrogen assimilation transcriptional regulator